MEFRDLKRQYKALQKDIDKVMSSVAANGTYIGGETVAELERQLAEYVGVKHCVTCANGTDALTIALKVWGVGKGDAVFVPDFTFFASAEVIAAEGATPVFVDVEAETFTISCKDLERKVEAVAKEGELRPVAVIPVDLFGLPANYGEIKPIAEKYGLYVLEDGAQGFGGMIDGKKACSFGGISTTSFFPAKPLGCYGDGGAIFTDNDEWAKMAKSIKVHGKGANKYDNVRIGLNSRLDTLQAAILQVKFRAFVDYELEAVNNHAKMYSKLINCPNLATTPYIPSGWHSSWAQYTIRLKNREERDGLQAHLKANGIPSMVYYPTAMHAQTAFSGCRNYGDCPVTERLCDTVLSLPMHPYLTEDEIVMVTKKADEYLSGIR
ncbi:MAG: DegT/DnrJ/EryC1/StrS family aminotransferase [Paludibacteraceae bacterium]|nr:DegT/DnrJ/EryC1/StrS family aminotransferase [Paludibacteraceae bacterium]